MDYINIKNIPRQKTKKCPLLTNELKKIINRPVFDNQEQVKSGNYYDIVLYICDNYIINKNKNYIMMFINESFSEKASYTNYNFSPITDIKKCRTIISNYKKNIIDKDVYYIEILLSIDDINELWNLNKLISGKKSYLKYDFITEVCLITIINDNNKSGYIYNNYNPYINLSSTLYYNNDIDFFFTKNNKGINNFYIQYRLYLFEPIIFKDNKYTVGLLFDDYYKFDVYKDFNISDYKYLSQGSYGKIYKKNDKIIKQIPVLGHNLYSLFMEYKNSRLVNNTSIVSADNYFFAIIKNVLYMFIEFKYVDTVNLNNLKKMKNKIDYDSYIKSKNKVTKLINMLHKKKLYHRDISLNNILISYKIINNKIYITDTYIIDFGASCVYSSNNNYCDLLDYNNTSNLVNTKVLIKHFNFKEDKILEYLDNIAINNIYLALEKQIKDKFVGAVVGA